jgi:hypothetical protein
VYLRVVVTVNGGLKTTAATTAGHPQKRNNGKGKSRFLPRSTTLRVRNDNKRTSSSNDESRSNSKGKSKGKSKCGGSSLRSE